MGLLFFLEDHDAVRHSFVYLRRELTFEYLRDELVQKNLLSDREKEDIVCKIPEDYFMIGKTIKLMIMKNRCKEFVELIGKMPKYRHVFEKLKAARQLNNNPEHKKKTCKKIKT